VNKSLMWRGGLILGAVALAVWGAVPPQQKINLGLDLRGGMYLSLRVQTEDAVRAETDKDMERVRVELKDKQIASVEARRTSDTTFDLLGVPVDKGGDVSDVVKKYLGDNAWSWRRDGDRIAFEMQAPQQAEIKRAAVDQALITIRNRIDEFGVGETAITRQGLNSERLVVQLPGVVDAERVKALIGRTAFLEFRIVDFPTGGGGTSKEQILAHYNNQLPQNVELFSGETRDRQGRTQGETFYALERRPVITGRDLKSARAGLGQYNDPVVNFSLTHDGAKLFGDATGANVGRGLAIVLDGKVMSAPVINSRITDSGVIEGKFTQKEVEDLSNVLHSGALPAGIQYLEERTVGPSLGSDSIRDGLRAGLVGAILVVLTMLIVYRGSGMNAVVALAINLMLIIGCLAYFHATLTLPGIAGIVLTIGIAVDANVLVFERIKEELRAGRTVKAAVEAGFKHALPSILDANICTLISALFLFQFGTGPVRGFAVTLTIGIVGTVFAALVISRWMFDAWLSRNERVDSLSI
jgi:preprotein translocase subunit SecD